MDNDTERLLQANGWEVECYSPLEVRHSESGSFCAFQILLPAPVEVGAR